MSRSLSGFGSHFLQYNRDSRIRQVFPGKYHKDDPEDVILYHKTYDKWDFLTQFLWRMTTYRSDLLLAGVILFRYNVDEAI